MPLIGVTACRIRTEAHAQQRVTEKYVTVVVDEVGACPVMIPALEVGMHPEVLVRRLDGILLTGSPSNVDPRHYLGTPGEDPDEHDPARDAVTLPLIRAAVDAGVPILGLCRGVQEMNVAFGGSLLQRIHDDTGKLDHRMRRDVPAQGRPRPCAGIDRAIFRAFGEAVRARLGGIAQAAEQAAAE